MGSIAELGAVMMRAAERRIDVAAGNLSNASTPSFRARRVFSQIFDARMASPVDGVVLDRLVSAEALKFTGSAFDVTNAGEGAFLVRDANLYFAVRSVQLHRDVHGSLVDSAGRVLQSAGGGDVVVGPGAPSILPDGTVLIDGQAAARIGVFDSRDHGAPILDLPEGTDSPLVRQGFLASSSVDPATEMMELSKAGRLAETGARVFQIQDELIGEAARKLVETAS